MAGFSAWTPKIVAAKIKSVKVSRVKKEDEEEDEEEEEAAW